MVNLDEKLELAKQLHLHEQVSQLEYRKGMFDLTFKEITESEINKRLSGGKFCGFKFPLSEAWFYFIPCVIVMFTGIWDFKNECGQALTVIYGCLSLLTGAGTLLDSIKIRRVVSCWVDDFKHDIPYGAMLALKEAGEKGILHHRIYYPVIDSLYKPNNDPIITGVNRFGKTVEIYAWNEDDVYAG